MSSLTYIGCFKFQVQSVSSPQSRLSDPVWGLPQFSKSTQLWKGKVGDRNRNDVLVMYSADTDSTEWGSLIEPSAVAAILSRHTAPQICSQLLEGGNGSDGGRLFFEILWEGKWVRLFQTQCLGKCICREAKLVCSVWTCKSVTTPTQLPNTSHTWRRWCYLI